MAAAKRSGDVSRKLQAQVASSKPMETGFHRIHLAFAATGEWLTCYVPLDSDHRPDRSAPRPWLGKALWSGEEVAFELVPDTAERTRIVWPDAEYDSLIELGRAPLRVGAIVRVFASDEPDDEHWDYVVRDVKRV